MFPFRLQNKSGGSFYGTTTLHCIGFLIFPASLLLLLLLGLTFLFSLFQFDVQAVKDRNPISDDTRFLRIIVDTAINHVVILLCAGFFGTFCGAILQKLLMMQQFRLLFSKKLFDFLHVVLSLVSEMLKAIAEYAKHDRAEFVRVVQEAQSSQQTAEVKKQRIRLATAKQRVSELEVLLCKIYEDNILGKLSDSRYATLDAQYEKEQSELTVEISDLEKAIKSYEKHEKDADRFIALIDKYENFDKLTIAMLNEFIEKILVHERDRKGSIQTTQEVEIYFNFVGRFVPPAFGEVELTPEELEEIRKREERKDRLHQNYLKRKANGKQKEYEERTKAKKKAEIEARKQAIRTEDIARGVFIPVSSLPQLGPRKGA